jgi:hypothetical protein
MTRNSSSEIGQAEPKWISGEASPAGSASGSRQGYRREGTDGAYPSLLGIGASPWISCAGGPTSPPGSAFFEPFPSHLLRSTATHLVRRRAIAEELLALVEGRRAVA